MKNFYQMLVFWAILFTASCSAISKGENMEFVGFRQTNQEAEGKTFKDGILSRIKRYSYGGTGDTLMKCEGGSIVDEIEKVLICDGENDCHGSEDADGKTWDEQYCSCWDGEFQCVITGECIPIELRCDGIEHCRDATDELNCPQAEKLESTEDSSNEQDSNEYSSQSSKESILVHPHVYFDSDKSKSAEVDSNESFSNVEEMLTFSDDDSDEVDSNEEYSKERMPIKFNSNGSNSFEDYSNENQSVKNMKNGTHSNSLEINKLESHESNTTVEKTPNLIDVDSGELDSDEEFSKERIPKLNTNESNSLEGYSDENQLVEDKLNGTYPNNLDLDESDSNETNTKSEDISKEEMIVHACNEDMGNNQRLMQLEIGLQEMKDNVLELTQTAEKGEQTLSKLRVDVARLTELLSQFINYHNVTVSTGK